MVEPHLLQKFWCHFQLPEMHFLYLLLNVLITSPTTRKSPSISAQIVFSSPQLLQHFTPLLLKHMWLYFLMILKNLWPSRPLKYSNMVQFLLICKITFTIWRLIPITTVNNQPSRIHIFSHTNYTFLLFIFSKISPH